jgi:hypothetical protein
VSHASVHLRSGSVASSKAVARTSTVPSFAAAVRLGHARAHGTTTAVQARDVRSSNRLVARLARAVRPSAASAPLVGLAVPRSFVSLALRSTAAPGCLGRAGIGFAHAGCAGALRLQAVSKAVLVCARRAFVHRCWPNWSVEATSNGGPQWLASSTAVAPLAAPHLQRWASQVPDPPA